MWVSRLVDKLGLWAVVEEGPCPWCSEERRHRHLVLEASVDELPVLVDA